MALDSTPDGEIGGSASEDVDDREDSDDDNTAGRRGERRSRPGFDDVEGLGSDDGGDVGPSDGDGLGSDDVDMFDPPGAGTPGMGGVADAPGSDQGGGASKSGGDRGSVEDDDSSGGDGDGGGGGDGDGDGDGGGGGGLFGGGGPPGTPDSGGTADAPGTDTETVDRQGDDRTTGPTSEDTGDGGGGGVPAQDTPGGRQPADSTIPNPIQNVQFGDDTTEASDVSTQIEAQTDLEAGRDFTVERGDDAFGIEYTSEYFQRQYAEDYDQRYEGVEVEAGDVEVVRTEEDGDSVVSPELDTDTQREIAAAELDEDYSQISITLEDITGIEDTEDGGTRPVLSQEAEDRIIESETASDLGVSMLDIEVEQGQLRAETSRGAAALAEYQLDEQTGELENVTVDELVPGVVEASGDPTGGEVAAPGQQSTTVASEAGRDLLADLADYSDERADLRSDALESRRVEAGVQARADAAAGEEAVDITKTVFGGADGSSQIGNPTTGGDAGEDPATAADAGEDPATAADAPGLQSDAEAETYGADVPDLEEVTPGDTVGQQSATTLDSPLGPTAKSGGQGVADFLTTGADRALPVAQAALNPTAADLDADPVQAITDPAGDALDTAVGAAAFQFSPLLAARDDVADVATDTAGEIATATDTVADVTTYTARRLNQLSAGIAGDTADAVEDASVPDVDAAVPDVVTESYDDVASGLDTAATRGAASSLVYLSPFARAADPVADTATDVGSTTLDVGADVFDAGSDVARDLDDATGGTLGQAAGVLGTPLANTIFLGAEGARAADDVADLDKSDYDDAADAFLENATQDSDRVTGGPLPVFSVSTPAGVQSFLAGSDDAATAAQLGGGRGSAAAGGSAAGGPTGTAAAEATNEALEAAALATTGAFVDELDVNEDGMFVDEQEVTGTEDVFVDEMPIPDPTQLDVGPLGVPELGIQIGPGENQANWEVDELDVNEDGMFVDELDVSMQDDTDMSVTVDASTAVGTGAGTSTGVGTGPGTGTGTGPGVTPGGPSIGGDTADGGGFDVGGRPSPGLSIGSDSGVRFVGRTPNPDSTLTDATDEFFGVELGSPFEGVELLDSAQQSVSGGSETSIPYGGADVTGDATPTTFADTDAGNGSGTGPATDEFGVGDVFGDAPSLTGPASTGATTAPAETASPPATATGAPTTTATALETALDYESPALDEFRFEVAGPTVSAPTTRRPPRPPRKPPLPDLEMTALPVDDGGRDDSRASKLFTNPTISPSEALGYNPLDEDGSDEDVGGVVGDDLDDLF